MTRGSAPGIRLAGYPFRLGVASGEPLPDGVVLWTRLAPDPLAGDGRGGMPPRRVPVAWQVATDERFRRVVASGEAVAMPRHGHSVHVEVVGLKPARRYWYRFRVGTDTSPVGRTRTAPDRSARVDRLRFAFASCQSHVDGFYVAHRDLARQDLDLVLFLGDYIYEGPAQGDLGRGHRPARELTTLADYRLRYAQYRADPDLQAAHQAFPWLAVLDDHEVARRWDGDMREPGFLRRRAAAFRAFYEFLPLRRTCLPRGPAMQLHRRVVYGDLAEIHLLDTRQYRHGPARCRDSERVDGYCPEALHPNRTILGEAQRRALFADLGRSEGRWNVLANQGRMAPYDVQEGPGRRYENTDTWGDGYVADRWELFDVLRDERVPNPVVVTGDAHKNWVFDLKDDVNDPTCPTVATELVGTSMTTAGDRPTIETRWGGTAHNPHEVFADGHRGYVRCEVTRGLWRADFRVCDTVRSREGSVSTLASFVVEDGRPGAVPA